MEESNPTPPAISVLAQTEIDIFLNQMEDNPLSFGMTYFPHHFRMPSPKFHSIILEKSLQNKFFAVAAPRGSAKSTLIMFLVPTFFLTFRKKHHIILVSNTFKKSAQSLETIKKEFKTNKRLKEHFKILIAKDTEGEAIFRHSNGFEIRVLCKGADQIGSIRGEKFGAYRPDLILVDDLEDDEMVRSKERRINLREVFEDVITHAIDVNENFNIFVLGTILHDDSLLSHLLAKDEYTQFYKIKYEALITRGNLELSLWDDKWTVPWLKDYAQKNPSSFAKELQNNPVSGREARFKKEDFRYWGIDNMQFVLFDVDGTVTCRGPMTECKAAIGCDLAWSEKKGADYLVIMPVYVTPYGDLLVDTYFSGKGVRPDQFCENLFTIESKLRMMTNSSVPIGFEKAMLEKVTHWILRSEMKKRNHWLITKELKWETDKITRIETVLQPRYSQHIVYHKRSMGELELQLERFPSAVHDDHCFIGETLIKTNRGNIQINKITPDDMVLTRDGFKKVLKVECTGIKEVITQFGLTGTPNHPIFTKNGIKRFDNISVSDTLYIWNEKLYCIEERNIIDILTPKEDSIGYISGDMIHGNQAHSHFIDKFGLIISVLFRKSIQFITKTKILSTIQLKISNCFHRHNICQCTQANQNELLNQDKILQSLESKLANGTVLKQEENGIQKNLRSNGLIPQYSHVDVLYAESAFNHATQMQNLVHKNAENAKRKLSLSKRKVYNLLVESNHEYFANNILVHNCDALQSAVRLLEFPKTIKKKEKVDSDFDFWRNLAIKQKEKPKKKPFIFGNKLKRSTSLNAWQGFIAR